MLLLIDDIEGYVCSQELFSVDIGEWTVLQLWPARARLPRVRFLRSPIRQIAQRSWSSGQRWRKCRVVCNREIVSLITVFINGDCSLFHYPACIKSILRICCCPHLMIQWYTRLKVGHTWVKWGWTPLDTSYHHLTGSFWPPGRSCHGCSKWFCTGFESHCTHTVEPGVHASHLLFTSWVFSAITASGIGADTLGMQAYVAEKYREVNGPQSNPHQWLTGDNK